MDPAIFYCCNRNAGFSKLILFILTHMSGRLFIRVSSESLSQMSNALMNLLFRWGLEMSEEVKH